MDKRILFAGLVFVFVLGFFILGPMLKTEQDSGKSSLNINHYSSIISSSAPKAFMEAYAQTIDSTQSPSVSLVVYQQGMALVNETRKISLENGLNLLNFGDVPKMIDISSVSLNDTKYPDTKVIEQTYSYDTASDSSLLEKFLGKDITVEVNEGNSSKTYGGKLLSYNDGIMLETENGIVSFKNIEKIIFPQDSSILTKPTLVLKVYTTNAGERDVKVSYISNGFSWNANYVAKLNEQDNAIDLTGNVLVSNNSGTSFSNANLVLLAGQVNRSSSNAYYPMVEKTMAADVGGAAAPSPFTQSSSFEYHTYTLDHATDLIDKQSKQILLLEARNVPVTKEYVFDGSNYYYGGSQSQAQPVDVKIAFKNNTASNLGMPLPAGSIKVYKDANGTSQFLGEDSIDHTPAETERKLTIGKAFDITAEKKTISSQNFSNCNNDSYQVVLNNQKGNDVTVKVLQSVYGNFEVKSNNFQYTKLDAYTLEFSVLVKAQSKATLEYTIKTCGS